MLRIRGMMGRMQEHLHIFRERACVPRWQWRQRTRELMTGAEIADLVSIPMERAEVRLEAKIEAKHLRIDTFLPIPVRSI
jgi:hypothetical protein